MDVRAHVSMLFHLDKCIGCHTCSIACKNIWTDRKGAEYMWWNNVESRPGAGYPTGWENQSHYQGGWQRDGTGRIRLRLHSRAQALARLFFSPALPDLEDYYEPFTFRYQDLFSAPESDDQPTAVPVSLVTGKEMDISSGPNWDDDLSGSPIYAASDSNLDGVDDDIRRQMWEIERVVFNYLPRICNHCLNPACVAACPSGAIYKRGEDGVVLVNEHKCRGWRMCVSGCPYKKVYYNWASGKSEKCILCFPRLETGQAPACAHSCVGRIRYIGVLLYDAGRLPSLAERPDRELIDAQRDAILDPWDAAVVAEARQSGVDDGWIDAARRSPVYRFVKKWGIALPLHAEFRTVPMMFYVPPLSPIVSTVEQGLVRLDLPPEQADFELFRQVDKARLPVQYLANLLAAGDAERVRGILRKMLAVRLFKRRQSVEGEVGEATMALLKEAGVTPTEAEETYQLTTQATFEERFVLPPYHREVSAEYLTDPLTHKGDAGFGYIQPAKRGA